MSGPTKTFQEVCVSQHKDFKQFTTQAEHFEESGLYYRDLFKTTNDIQHITLAAQHHKKALESTPKEHSHHAKRLFHVGIAYYKKYQRVGECSDLDEARTALFDAVYHQSVHQLDLPLLLEYFGMASLSWHQRVEVLSDRIHLAGTLTHLEDAFTYLKYAIASTTDKPSRARQIQTLGNAYKAAYSRTFESAKLYFAIHCYQTALNLTPNATSSLACQLQTVGIGYRERYNAWAMEEDLSLAMLYFKRALDLTAADHPDRGSRLECLGVAYQDVYRLNGSVEDLEKGIQILKDALEDTLKKTTNNKPKEASLLQCLGKAYGDRYQRSSAMTDLELAIQYDQKALKLTDRCTPSRPDVYDDPQLIYRLRNLGMKLRERFIRARKLEDIEQAIRHDEDALDLRPDDTPDPATPWRLLGIKYQDKYTLTNSFKDLSRGIDYLTAAVESHSENDLDRADRFESLGLGLYERYKSRKASDDLVEASHDLAEAIERFRKALELTPADRPDRARRLHSLGLGYRDTYRISDNRDDLERAIRRFKEALQHPVSPPADRFVSGRELVDLYSQTEDWHLAHDTASATLPLISLLLPRSLKSSDKQYVLRQVVGLASDAAAIALNAGKGPSCATELLETGRSILAASLQDLRTDLSMLHAQYPDLAQSFTHFRDQLDPLSSQLDLTQTKSATVLQTEADRRHEASNQMLPLLEEVRSKPGFSRFLLPPSEDKIRKSAVGGSIIIVNVSTYRCDALVVEESTIQALRLQELLPQDISARMRHVRSLKTLEWLWDTIVSPVFDAIGLHGPPGTSWPHVWWIPTGPLVGFPIHAAGRHFESGFETVIDRAISSYAASIKGMIHHQQQKDQDFLADLSKSAVFVAMPDTPDERSLDHVENETSAVEAICLSMGLPCVKPEPYKQEILEALASCMIFHFAGHGNADRADPLKSLLMLQDWRKNPLTLESLLSTNLSSSPPFLAYLSACGTGQIRHEDSLDENVHLSSAFQIAGFRHVIGTLWEVDDELCVRMGKLTYQYLSDKGFSDKSVSGGLHYAARELRDEWLQETNNPVHIGTDKVKAPVATRNMARVQGWGQNRLLWVPYIHYGV